MSRKTNVIIQINSLRKNMLVKLLKEERECDLKSRKRKKSKKRVLSIEQGYKIIYKEQGSNKKKD